MTATSTRYSDPVDDTRRAHAAARSALRAAVTRSASLWRDIPDPHARIPGLTWTAAEAAAHVVGELRDYTDALTGRGETAGAGGATNVSPSRGSAVANAQQLAAIPERNMARLAVLLQEQVERYLAAATRADENADIVTANGLVMTPPVMTGLLLGEQLLHGLDIARAARQPWHISPSDALLVIPAVMTVAPRYLRRSVSDDLDVSFELRMRGGPRYRLAVSNGAAEMTAAGDKADCVITADPVAFLQLGYGRITQWRAIIGGKMFASGRKPWLAAKFATLLASP